MATAVLSCSIPVAEYLATIYHPDCDYIDGELKERNLGETPHSGLQIYLGALFVFHEASWGLRAFTEQRVQINSTRFRIPDLCAIPLGDSVGPIIRTAPTLCIEILSPGDTLGSLERRIADYVSLGVPNIWLIDPVERLAWTADANGIHPLSTGEFTLENTPVRIALADLYARLDRLEAGN